MTPDSWLTIIGVLLVVVGAAMVYPPAAVILLGGACLYAAARWQDVDARAGDRTRTP